MTPSDFASAKELKAWFKTLDPAAKKEHGRAFNDRMGELSVKATDKPQSIRRVARACPNCDWANNTTYETYLGWLQTICDNCHMAGPKAKSVEDAKRYWDRLPRRQRCSGN